MRLNVLIITALISSIAVNSYAGINFGTWSNKDQAQLSQIPTFTSEEQAENFGWKHRKNKDIRRALEREFIHIASGLDALAGAHIKDKNYWMVVNGHALQLHYLRIAIYSADEDKAQLSDVIFESPKDAYDFGKEWANNKSHASVRGLLELEYRQRMKYYEFVSQSPKPLPGDEEMLRKIATQMEYINIAIKAINDNATLARFKIPRFDDQEDAEHYGEFYKGNSVVIWALRWRMLKLRGTIRFLRTKNMIESHVFDAARMQLTLTEIALAIAEHDKAALGDDFKMVLPVFRRNHEVYAWLDKWVDNKRMGMLVMVHYDHLVQEWKTNTHVLQPTDEQQAFSLFLREQIEFYNLVLKFISRPVGSSVSTWSRQVGPGRPATKKEIEYYEKKIQNSSNTQ
jgi:hypothetical protein